MVKIKINQFKEILNDFTFFKYGEGCPKHLERILNFYKNRNFEEKPIKVGENNNTQYDLFFINNKKDFYKVSVNILNCYDTNKYDIIREFNGYVRLCFQKVVIC